jgi:hypothetical protein
MNILSLLLYHYYTILAISRFFLIMKNIIISYNIYVYTNSFTIKHYIEL